MNITFGCSVGSMPPRLIKKVALKAESLGFDCLWGSDHLMAPFPAAKPGYNEAWTSMSYLGGMTRHVKLSHMVSVTGFRHPALLAQMVSTLDHFTEGRVILTTGAGWYRKEFEAFGLPWDKHHDRVAREREAIQIIRSLWRNGVVDFHGKYYTLQGASLDPGPFQAPSPPLWIGGDSRQTMELAAELGDGWVMHGHSPDEVARMVSRIDPLLRGRSEGMTFATALFIVMDKSRAAADRKMHSKIPEDRYKALISTPVRLEVKHRILGPPEACVVQIRRYIEAGIGHLILIFIDLEDMDRFARDVLPEFKSP